MGGGTILTSRDLKGVRLAKKLNGCNGEMGEERQIERDKMGEFVLAFWCLLKGHEAIGRGWCECRWWDLWSVLNGLRWDECNHFVYLKKKKKTKNVDINNIIIKSDFVILQLWDKKIGRRIKEGVVK